jgi:hypothetical protein
MSFLNLFMFTEVPADYTHIVKHNVVHLLKARTAEPEQQPLLGNAHTKQ